MKWQPIALFLRGECHGQRSLVGYSLWGRKDSNTTEQFAPALWAGSLPPEPAGKLQSIAYDQIK